MDLTKQFPRGPRERAIGVAMLARTIDKARAKLAGTLGEYYFDCPMDRQLFATLGIDADAFLDAVLRSPDDWGVIEWLKRRGALPSAAVLAAHNQAIESWAPKTPEGRIRFEASREKVAPGRSDIMTWTDLIDVEEGRLAVRSG